MIYAQILQVNGVTPKDLKRVLRRDLFWFIFKCALVLAAVFILAMLATRV